MRETRRNKKNKNTMGVPPRGLYRELQNPVQVMYKGSSLCICIDGPFSISKACKSAFSLIDLGC